MFFEIFNKLKNIARNKKVVSVDSPSYNSSETLRMAKYRLDNFKCISNDIIDYMESKMEDNLPSCKNVIMNQMKQLIDNSFEEAKKWDDKFNYEEHAYKVIYNISYVLLTCGEFHMYRGMLDPFNESTHLVGVCEQCLEWLEKNGYIDEYSKHEQLNILWDEIQQVG